MTSVLVSTPSSTAGSQTETAKALEVETEAAVRAGHRRLRASLDQLHDAVSVWEAIRDENGVIIDFLWSYANPVAAEMAGYAAEDAVGRKMMEVHADHGPSGMFDLYCRVVETGLAYVDENRWFEDKWADGRQKRRAFDVRATKVGDGFTVVTREVTQLRELTEELERVAVESERSNTDINVLNELGELMQACASPQEVYPIAASSAGRLFPGCSGALSIVNESRDMLELASSWGTMKTLRAVFQSEDCWATRRDRPHLSGGDNPVCPHLAGIDIEWCLCVPMVAQGATLGIIKVLKPKETKPGETAHEPEPRVERLTPILGRHIAMAIANLRLRQHLRDMSIRDPLTGLFNRRYMEETLTRELARAEREKGPLAVIHIDIDHFKMYNDTHGHDAGDAVMRTVARLLQDAIRDSDVACRYGGEELTVLLPGCSLADAEERGQAIRLQVEELRIPYDQIELRAPTISVGVAVYPDHGLDPRSLIKAADGALYMAKARGRNRVQIAVLDSPESLSPAAPSPKSRRTRGRAGTA